MKRQVSAWKHKYASVAEDQENSRSGKVWSIGGRWYFDFGSMNIYTHSRLIHSPHSTNLSHTNTRIVQMSSARHLDHSSPRECSRPPIAHLTIGRIHPFIVCRRSGSTSRKKSKDSGHVWCVCARV